MPHNVKTLFSIALFALTFFLFTGSTNALVIAAPIVAISVVKISVFFAGMFSLPLAALIKQRKNLTLAKSLGVFFALALVVFLIAVVWLNFVESRNKVSESATARNYNQRTLDYSDVKGVRIAHAIEMPLLETQDAVERGNSILHGAPPPSRSLLEDPAVPISESIFYTSYSTQDYIVMLVMFTVLLTLFLFVPFLALYGVIFVLFKKEEDSFRKGLNLVFTISFSVAALLSFLFVLYVMSQ